MKKLFAICFFLMAVLTLVSCKKEKVEVVEEEVVAESVCDSVEVLETPADTLMVEVAE